MTNAARAQLDLEAFARELQQQTGGKPGAPSAKDPLAELARIVGQDDPFRALLAARDERRGEQDRAAAHPAPQSAMDPSWQGRVEPSFAPESHRPNPADAFDQYLASVEQAPPESYGEEPAADQRALKRVRPRRRLATVGAGVAVVAVAVSGALAYKGLSGGHSGGVPVIQADTAPLKVAPKVADGVEIPDQNRQIYEPKAKDSQIRIVNREEQPIDIGQAARAAQTGAVTPGSAPLDAFGEPRRVRTVAVKPDTPPATAPAPQREAADEAPPVSPIPTMTMPTDEPAPRARPARLAAATPQVPVQAPVQAAQPIAQPAPAAPEPAAAQARPAPSIRKAPQRLASASPDSVIPAEPATTAAADTPAVSSAAVGGFSVQLGVRNSAGDAQTALREMQRKYSQLAGKPELIRQAEVNGKTIFRVRVGPLAKAEATSLCSELQGAGGQCFVAKN
ncbi:SPOR domain-containing protein [Methylobacterium radiodurans]|uniref:SPOR domain-containing protein n=1 Tax=Methylobacterium radiodurans TaxID=2202828 RepID=A0A2U8VVI8_9HYPH|nr:SPOR domain-containing protein [Methylobacterium radiodurans]AWN37252.1 SPOR domain-containing protein [Methylobacterium radiodurans]